MFRFDREKYETSGAYVECQQRYGKSLIEYLTIVSQAHHSQVKYLEKG